MKLLWKKSPQTANEIIDRQRDSTRWSPKTAKTLLTRLVKKSALLIPYKNADPGLIMRINDRLAASPIKTIRTWNITTGVFVTTSLIHPEKTFDPENPANSNLEPVAVDRKWGFKNNELPLRKPSITWSASAGLQQ
jgi:hypothetical protein